MDCTKLHQDIARLTRQKDQLEAKLRHTNETMQGKSELKSLVSESESLETSILEDHLHAFAEKNPWLNAWQFGDRITGFKDRRGPIADVHSIASLPNGNMLIGGGGPAKGNNGALYEYIKDKDGTYHLGNLITGFKDGEGEEASIRSIAPLPNGNMLIGGGRWFANALYEYVKDKDGTYHFGNRITGFKDEYGIEAAINSIAPLPNGNMLIGGYGNGILYEYIKDEDGTYHLGNRITGFKDGEGEEASIRSIAPLPNGNMLIGGGGPIKDNNSALYEYVKDKDGTYHLGNRIAGFEDERGVEVTINSIAPLPNGNMLIGGRGGTLYEYIKDKDGTYYLGSRITEFEDKTTINSIAPLPNGNLLMGGNRGALYEYAKDENGTYHLGNRITGFKNKRGVDLSIYFIAPLPNGSVLIGGENGALREAHKPPLTVDTLRQNLDRLEEQ